MNVDAFISSREQCELKGICRRKEELSKLSDEARKEQDLILLENLMNVPAKFSNLNTEKSHNYLRQNSNTM